MFVDFSGMPDEHPISRFVGLAVVLLIMGDEAHAQLPLGPVSGAGSTVTPAFEGWYQNPDGSFSLSFARGESDLDIPPGQIAVTQDFHVLPAPDRLENFQPHMHMRGKAGRVSAPAF